MKYLIVIALALFSLIYATPANAVADDATPTAQVTYPLPMQRVQIEGGQGTGIRTIARELDSSVAGLRIFMRGTCKARPDAVCVRIQKRHYGDTGWYAQTTFPDWNRRVIQVNLDAPHYSNYAVIVHEFGHVVGLHHHAQEGVCGASPDVLHFSSPELKVLRAAYPKRNL